MQLIIGGAFSGKRKIVKERYETTSWVTAYQDDHLHEWKTRWENGTTLVLEGWEKWISSEIKDHKSNQEIRSEFQNFFHRLLEVEQTRKNNIVLIMLDIGRGIVPLKENERRLRDIAGWVAQDAAELSDHVHYVWNGLSRELK